MLTDAIMSVLIFDSYALHPPRSPTWGRFNRDGSPIPNAKAT